MLSCDVFRPKAIDMHNSCKNNSGFHMTSKYDHANYDQFSPNFGVAC